MSGELTTDHVDVVRGALHRPHATQPARPAQHRLHHPPGLRRSQLRFNGGVSGQGRPRQTRHPLSTPLLPFCLRFLFTALEPLLLCKVEDPAIFPVQHVRVGTRYPAPSLPGLGVEIDEAELMKLDFKIARGDLFLRRKDGSVTNW